MKSTTIKMMITTVFLQMHLAASPTPPIGDAVAQQILDASGNGNGVIDLGGSVSVTRKQDPINWTNTTGVTGGYASTFEGAMGGKGGQLIVDASGRGVENGGEGIGGIATLSAKSSALTIINQAAISGGSAGTTEDGIAGIAGQIIIDASGRGNESGIGQGGTASLHTKYSSITVANELSQSIIGGGAGAGGDSYGGGAGQIIIDASGVGVNGSGTGGSAAFNAINGVINVSNQDSSTISCQGAGANNIATIGGAGQFVIDASGNAFDGPGKGGVASVWTENSAINVANTTNATINGSGGCGSPNDALIQVIGQMLIKASGNGIDAVGEGGQATLFASNSPITVINEENASVCTAGGLGSQIDAITSSVGQLVIDGSGTGMGIAQAGIGGIASLSISSSPLTLINDTNGAIDISNGMGGENSCIASSIGQLVLDGSGKGGGNLSGTTGSARGGSVSFTAEDSAITLNNNIGSVINASGAGGAGFLETEGGVLLGAVGQLILDGKGVGINTGCSGTGGTVYFTASQSPLTITNSSGGVGSGFGSGSGLGIIQHDIGQLFLDGSGHSLYGNGLGGTVKFYADYSPINLTNEGTGTITTHSCAANMGVIVGNAGQLVVNGCGKTTSGVANGNKAKLEVNYSPISLLNDTNAIIGINGNVGSGNLVFVGMAGQAILSSGGISSGINGTASGGNSSIIAYKSDINAINNGIISGYDCGASNGVIAMTTGQLLIDGSGTGLGGTAYGGNTFFELDGSSLTLGNQSGATMQGGNSWSGAGVVSGTSAQWLIKGSGTGISGTGIGGTASIEASDSPINVTNGGNILAGTCAAQFGIIGGLAGQVIVESNGLGINAGNSSSGTGSMTSFVSDGPINLVNQSGGSVHGGYGSGGNNPNFSLPVEGIVSGAAGQLLIHGRGIGVYGTGTGGTVTFNAAYDDLNITNAGALIGANAFANTVIDGGSAIAGNAGQILVDASGVGIQSNGTGGTAALVLKYSGMLVNNQVNSTITAGNGSTDATTALIVNGSAGQMIVAANGWGSSGVGSGGTASLIADNTYIQMTNNGAISANNDSGLAAQIIFDGSIVGVGSNGGTAVFNAGEDVILAAINDSTGTIVAGGTTPAQIYFHNASVVGNPTLIAMNTNPAAAIEGIIFDQDSSADRAHIVLANSSLVIDTVSPITIGSLSGNDQSVVKLGNDLIINTPKETYLFEGVISGTGNLTLQGRGTEIFTGANSFTGLTEVNGGTLVLNGSLAGSLEINSGGVLRGTGTVYSPVSNNGGVISPGQSIGTLHFLDGFTNNGGEYDVEVNGLGQSDLIQVEGPATLNGGTVVVSSVDGTYQFQQPYRIITASSLTGTFSDAISLSLIDPVLTYDAADAYVTIYSDISRAAKPCQLGVAQNLDGIVNLTDSQALILNTIIGLSNEKANEALMSFSGFQYASDVWATEIANRRFLRRLYDPLRSIVTNNACDPCCQGNGYEAWLNVGGGFSRLKGSDQAHGLHMSSYELTGGIQKTFCSEMTAGIAGSYENDQIHYSHGGKGNRNIGFVGVYGLYQTNCFYGLADVTYGHTTNRLKREIHIGSLDFKARSKPTTSTAAFYGELGTDLNYSCFLVQPFVGIQTGKNWRKHINENYADGWGLSVKEHDWSSTSGRLGVHLSTQNAPGGIATSLDIAWNRLLSSRTNRTRARFKEFGTPFTVCGIDLKDNSIDYALTFSSCICGGLQAYLEIEGESWNHANTFDASAGVLFSW